MPRRNQGTRRRTGCFQCKEKHIQCTEEHPRCRRCEIHGIECVRGLRLIFREDAVQRGISFGREGVWSKRPDCKTHIRKATFQGLPLKPYTDRWVFLNVTSDDFCSDIKMSWVPPAEAEPSISKTYLPLPLLPPPSLHHPLHSFSSTDSYLLDYFIRGISPSCSLSPSHNPYVSLVIPLCFTYDTLRNALLAVAANQLRLIGHPQFTKEACHYKQKALEGLRQEISSPFLDEGTVAAVLMLCFQDISDGCSPSWMTHLRGGLQLIEHNAQRNSPSLWTFFRMYFVAHDIMSRTASDDCDDDEALPLWSQTDDLEEIDVVMGCSRGLMSLINQISSMASTKAKILRGGRSLTVAERINHATAVSHLRLSLQSLEQKLPAHSIERNDLARVARVKQLAALLYLNERLGSSDHSCISAETEADAYRESVNGYLDVGVDIDMSRDHLISSIIELISTLPTMATLLWPLFVLGNVGLENEDHRRFVLDRLVEIQKSRNLGSVCRTIEAVKHSFGTRELVSSSRRIWGHESYRYISLA